MKTLDRKLCQTFSYIVPGVRWLFRGIMFLLLMLLGIFLVRLLFGSGEPETPEPKTLRTFEASLSTGIFSHDVHVKHGGPPLRSVDVTFTLYTAREKTVIERHWNHWESGETKVVSIPAVGGPLQRTEITGRAFGLPRGAIASGAESFWRGLHGDDEGRKRPRRSTSPRFLPPQPWILNGYLIWNGTSAQ